MFDGKTANCRTHSHLKRTRLIYAFYVVALPVYTVIGALIFQVSNQRIDSLTKCKAKYNFSSIGQLFEVMLLKICFCSGSFAKNCSIFTKQKFLILFFDLFCNKKFFRIFPQKISFFFFFFF